VTYVTYKIYRSGMSVKAEPPLIGDRESNDA